MQVMTVKQEWMFRADKSVGAFSDTPTFATVLGGPSIKTAVTSLYFGGDALASASGSVVDMSLESGLVALINAGIKSGISCCDVVYYGDTKFCATAGKVCAALAEFGRSVRRCAGVPTFVTEGPRDNHSRLEMSTAARNEGAPCFTPRIQCTIAYLKYW
jgi:hypothetical protein